MSLLGKIPYKNHGRRHAAGGSDPIRGYIHFGTNIGDGTQDLDIDMTSTGEMLVTSDTAELLVNGSEVKLQGPFINLVVNGASGLSITLYTGSTLTVFDSGNNPIFQVDEDGDLHGKTGKALTFDL